MHRDPWIPAEDRTKVFRLFGYSLWPQVHLQSIEEVFSDFDERCCCAHGFS